MAVISFGFCVVLSLTRGNSQNKKLTENAKKLHEEISSATDKKSTDDVMTLVKKALHRVHLDSDTAGSSTPELGFEAFSEIMLEVMNVSNREILRSIFDACDRDASGTISATELTTLLLAFRRDSSDNERIQMIFDCVDLDASGFITFDEAEMMLRGLLSIREVLLDHGGEMNMNDSIDAVVSSSGTYQESVSKERDPEKLRRIRLQDLRQRYSKFRNNKDSTLSEILDYEASRLSQSLLAEADVLNADNKISRDEFLQWVKSDSVSSRKFMHLFSVFTELLGE